MMTFEKWLMLHRECQDAIGDLARDYQFVCAENRANGIRKEKLTLRHMYQNNACQAAIDAFHEAKRIYKDFTRKNNDQHDGRS